MPYALGNKIESPVYTLRIGENGVTVDNVKSVIEDIKLEGLKRQNEGKSPLILFIDEADAMFPNREGADLMHNVSNSLDKTTTMLNAIQNLQKSGVLCIAATNHIENIDGPIKERLMPLEVGYPNKNDVKTIIANKFKNNLAKRGLDLSNIVEYFCDRDKSKLSPRVIITLLETALQQYASFDASTFYEKLKDDIQAKVDSINKNPTESGLTQIGKSLEEIKEAIKALKDNGVSAQLAEFAKAINANTKQNGQLVESFNNALSALQATMENINQIAENNTDLMKSYKELTGGVADSLNAVSGALDGNTNAIRTLNETQDKLRGLLEEIKKLQIRDHNISVQLGDIEKSFQILVNTIRALGVERIKQKILTELNSKKFIQLKDGAFQDMSLKIPYRTGFYLFSYPHDSENNNHYESFLTQMVNRFNNIIEPSSDKNFTIRQLCTEEKQEAKIWQSAHILAAIQGQINDDNDIQNLNELLQKFSWNEEGFNNSMFCFETLFNSFNWKSLLSSDNQENLFNDSVVIDKVDSKEASITYEKDKVKITKAAIPIIQNAFKKIFNRVFEIWIGGTLNELLNV